jgi:hypothetical protein
VKRPGWDIGLAILAGLLVGLLYAWVAAPLRYVDTSPDTLRADFKERYRIAIAAAYASTGNVERARARLNLLGDPDPLQALSSQAQQMLAAGEPFEVVRQVAQLASDLQQPGTIAQINSATPQFNTLPTNTPGGQTPTSTLSTPGLTETIIPGQVIEPPVSLDTPTPRPTRTPIPPAGAPFLLTGQDSLCEASLAEALLQIVLMDSRRRPAPGFEIVVTWTGGEDHFFTGFKPELGDGYADYVMQPEVSYNVRVAEGGPPVTNVNAPTCTGADGGTFPGSIRLTFQQQ